MKKVYVYERVTNIYCPITREEMVDMLSYVVKELPTLEELIYKMIESNQMTAIYGQHLLRNCNVASRVNWIDFHECYDLEDDDFTTVYDMSFELV